MRRRDENARSSAKPGELVSASLDEPSTPKSRHRSSDKFDKLGIDFVDPSRSASPSRRVH